MLDKALPKVNIEGSLPAHGPADEAELERISSPGEPVGAGSSSGSPD
jgi:hypothetical protein